MADGYVLKSSVLNAIHNGDIDMGIVTTHEYYLLKKLSKRIDRRIQRVPAPDVAPVRHGLWENINDLECFMCSCCGEYANQPWGIDGAIMFSYCPNCGAKMDEEDGDE